MAEYPIARVSVKNEKSGEFVPSDVRTRAEAVAAGDGRTAQEHLDDVQTHMSNPAIHSTAYIKPMWELTIPETGWVQGGPIGAEFPYSIELPYEGVLDTHNAEVTVDINYVRVAAKCGLCPTMETMHNGIKFWTRELPESPILCHMTLFGEGGINSGAPASGGGGGSGSGSGNYILPMASETVLGGVKIGDNIDIDDEGRITPTGVTLSEAQPATEEDINNIIAAVFGDASNT